MAVADVSWEDAAGSETEPEGGDYVVTDDVEDEFASDPELNPDAEPRQRRRCDAVVRDDAADDATDVVTQAPGADELTEPDPPSAPLP